jgi:hypothetical protein
MFFPIKAKPPDVCFDGIDIFNTFLSGICVVKSEMTFTFVFIGKAEIQANGFCMADMEVSIWLRRESRHNVSAKPIRLNIFIDEMSYKIRGRSIFSAFFHNTISAVHMAG